MSQKPVIIQVVEVPEQAAFTVSRAARYLGMSVNTLRKRADEGLIMARRDVSNNRVFLKRDLDMYLESLPIDNVTGYPRSSADLSTLDATRKEADDERPV